MLWNKFIRVINEVLIIITLNWSEFNEILIIFPLITEN